MEEHHPSRRVIAGSAVINSPDHFLQVFSGLAPFLSVPEERFRLPFTVEQCKSLKVSNQFWGRMKINQSVVGGSTRDLPNCPDSVGR